MMREKLFTRNWPNTMNDPQIQLFILPFAGGSKSAFREFESFFTSEIQVICLEYPGRGTRAEEPACTRMQALIQDMTKQIRMNRKNELPFAVMGYSMGCEIAFDLLQYALEEKAIYGVFCAREEIADKTKGYNYALLDDQQFLRKIVDLGGIDPRILKNERFLSIALRTLRADYHLLHQYEFHENRGKLSQNLAIFYCPEDTPARQVEGWQKRTMGYTNFYPMDGGHFFFQQHGKEMASIITDKLLQEISTNGGV